MSKVSGTIVHGGEERVLRGIPVAVNCQRGDPLQGSQWPDTKSKLKALASSRHLGPVGIITKLPPSEDQLAFLRASPLEPWLFMTITGLGESGRYGFPEMARGYEAACGALKRVVVNIQPVIPGRNDRMEILAPILALAERGAKKLTMRGFSDRADPEAPYRENASFREEVATRCSSSGTRIYATTSDAVRSEAAPEKRGLEGAAVLGLLRRLGYQLTMSEGRLVADDSTRGSTRRGWTRGDRNFISMIFPSGLSMPEPANSSMLSIEPGGVPLHCTSSWFSWARQVPCEVDCWYCSAAANPDLATRGSLGCDPNDLARGLAPPPGYA
jgi:hypothetical protein